MLDQVISGYVTLYHVRSG